MYILACICVLAATLDLRAANQHEELSMYILAWVCVLTATQDLAAI